MLKKHNMTLEQALSLAGQQVNLSNYRAAELILIDIVDAVPDCFDALHMLGVVKYHIGNLKEAIKFLEKATRLANVTAACYCNFGSFLAQDGQHDRACEVFDKAIELDASYPDSYWNKANILCLEGKYEEAKLAGKKAVELAPDRSEAWLNFGMVLAKLGEFEDAIAAWNKSIKLQENFALAYSNLGNIFRELGRYDEAKEHCLKALKIEPENTQAMNNLANILFDLGQIEEAENWYKKAVSLQPDYAEAHNNLAICLMQKHRFDEAVIQARYAISFQNDYAEAYMNMSRALRAMGEIEKAEDAVNQALLLYPDSVAIKIELADMSFMLGKDVEVELILSEIENMEIKSPQLYLQYADILEKSGKIEKAIATIEKSIKLNSNNPNAYIRKGQICHMFGDIEEAKKSYAKAEELQANNPSLYIAIADLYQSKGDKKNAEITIKKAQAISPDLPAIYSVLSKVKTFSTDDKDFLKMLELENGIEKRGMEAAASLYFALFLAFENMAKYDRAFEYLQKANNFKSKIINFDVDKQKDIFKKIKQDYTRQDFISMKDRGYFSDLPIFIIGMPRSGTTLTEQILAAHPDIYAAGELLDFGSTEQEYGSYMDKHNCANIGARYIEKLKKRDITGKALRVTDKMPANFMRLGQIVSALPNAKIIHCRRNSIDTCLSCYKQNFARGQEWSYKLDDIVEQYKLYTDLMNYWREILPNKFLEINYEDTVSDLKNQARKLIDYIGLDWNDACLAPHKYKRNILTASKMQVIKPVYKSSVNSWKNYRDHLEPLVSRLE